MALAAGYSLSRYLLDFAASCGESDPKRLTNIRKISSLNPLHAQTVDPSVTTG